MAALTALLSAAAPAAGAFDPRLTPLDGGPQVALSDIRSGPAIVLFWRSDCAPCLIELSHFAALDEAAGPGRILTVALEPAPAATAKLEELGLDAGRAYAVAGDAEAVLAAASEGGRRLPYAIALDAGGGICARHLGLLGTERAKDWMRRCST
jgi:thiol-disulfide isomerase/thioredoxin